MLDEQVMAKLTELKQQREDLIKTRDIPPWPFNHKWLRPIAMLMQPSTCGMDTLIRIVDVKIMMLEHLALVCRPTETTKAEDLDTKIILRELAKFQGKWATYGDRQYSMPNIQINTYPNVPRKLWLAKMKSIIRQGYSGGCDCGCRGDYEITDKGLELIGEKRIVHYNGY